MNDFDPDLDEDLRELSDEEKSAQAAAEGRRHARQERERAEGAYRASQVVAEDRRVRLAAERSRKLRRLGLGLGAAAVVGAIGFAVYKGMQVQENAQEEVARAAGPLVRAGFSVDRALSSQKGRAFTHKTTVDGCAAVVAAKGSELATIEVKRSSGSTATGKRVVVCSCGAEELDISVPDAKPDLPSGTYVLGILRGAAAKTGGARIVREAALPDVVVGEVPSVCEAEQLDAWLAKAQPKAPEGPLPPGAEGWQKRGFSPVSAGSVGASYAVVPPVSSGCLVTDPESPDIEVRTQAGPITRGAAFCADKAVPVTMHKPKDLAVTLLARSGGSALDLYEMIGAPQRKLAYVMEDAWKGEAARMLTESGVNPREVESPDKVRTGEKHRLLAILRVPDESVLKDLPLKGYVCSPRSPDELRSPVAVCILPRGKDAPVLRTKNYVAVAALPPFLTALAEAKDDRVLEAMGDALVLTRRLARRGFEPTLLESVKELGNGAEITGRAGDKEFAAMTLMPSPPYVTTLSVDGKPWPVLGEPRFFPIAPAKHVVATGAVSGAPASRRTIVFRRHGSP